MNTNFSALKTFKSLPYQIQEWLIAEDMAPVGYSVDAVVSSFLRKHDVFIEPPIQKPGVDASDRLLFAVSGPLAMANAGIKNQSKVANQAEWTSWKQWALSHQDFKEYKQYQEARVEKRNSEFNDWYDSQEAKDKISSLKLNAKKENRVLFYTVCIVVVGPFVANLVAVEISNRLLKPEERGPQRLQ